MSLTTNEAVSEGPSDRALRGVVAEKLTARQVDILRVLARTGSQKDAANELGLAESTIKAHMQEIRWKLRASNTTRAVIAALHLGYLRLEELVER